jgi:hypothetical protein
MKAWFSIFYFFLTIFTYAQPHVDCLVEQDFINSLGLQRAAVYKSLAPLTFSNSSTNIKLDFTKCHRTELKSWQNKSFVLDCTKKLEDHLDGPLIHPYILNDVNETQQDRPLNGIGSIVKIQMIASRCIQTPGYRLGFFSSRRGTQGREFLIDMDKVRFRKFSDTQILFDVYGIIQGTMGESTTSWKENFIEFRAFIETPRKYRVYEQILSNWRVYNYSDPKRYYFAEINGK